MLYIFTTIRKDLYRRDFLNICCLEENEFVRLGYRPRWVDKSLRLECGAVMKDQDAILIFCEFLDNEKSKFHPVRITTVAGVAQTRTGAFELTVKLGGFFNYGIGEKQIAEYIHDFQKRICDNETRPRMYKGEDLVDYFVCPISEQPNCDFKGEWDNLVKYMGVLKRLDDAVFLREYPERYRRRARSQPRRWWSRKLARRDAQRNLSEMDHGPDYSKFLKPAPPDPHTTRIDFSGLAGKIYDIQLHHMFGKNAFKRGTEKPAKIDVPEDIASICGPFLKQSGEGMDAHYLIALKPSFRTQVSRLIVWVEPPSKDNDNSEQMKICSSEIYGVLTVKPPKGWLVLAILLVIVGAVLFATAENLGSLVKDFCGEPYENTFTIIFKMVGVISPILGAFIGLHKLALELK